MAVDCTFVQIEWEPASALGGIVVLHCKGAGAFDSSAIGDTCICMNCSLPVSLLMSEIAGLCYVDSIEVSSRREAGNRGSIPRFGLGSRLHK